MTEPTPNPTPTPDPKPAGPTPPTFTADQEKEINGRIAAARRQAEADAKAKFEQTATERSEAEKAERERKEAEARGEFDTVKASLETDAKTHKERADAAEAKAATYEELIAPIVTERLDALKAASADVAKGFPTDASVLDQLAWLDDPRTKALIAQQDAKADNLRRFPMTPKPNAPLLLNDDDAKRAQARMYRDF